MRDILERLREVMRRAANEIERLRRERDASNRLALRLQGEIERLRAALEKYGEHKPGCEGPECNCGLSLIFGDG